MGAAGRPDSNPCEAAWLSAGAGMQAVDVLACHACRPGSGPARHLIMT